MDRNKRRVAHMEVQSDTLAIRWKDGRESRFDLADLRRNCPCATCAALRQEARTRADRPLALGELPVLNKAVAEATAQVRRLEPVGRYGVRIVWADGHDTGIYTFERLREEDENS